MSEEAAPWLDKAAPSAYAPLVAGTEYSSQLGPSTLGVGAYTASAAAIALSIGAGVGAINGVLVSYLRLPSIIVTLATMFVVQGAALLILKFPGGSVSSDFANLLVGDVIPDVLPVPILIIGLGMLAWLYLKRLRFGIGLYAIGSDAAAAQASRVDVRFVRFLSFTIAGAFFGAAGLFITANAGSGDPLIGAGFLLKVFAAVVLGGTLIGGGRGGALGTVFGALTLTIVVDIFLVMGVRTYYVPIVEGAILIFAVLALGTHAELPTMASIRGYWSGRAGRPVRSGPTAEQIGANVAADWQQPVGWVVRNAHTLRFVLPAFAILIVVLGITAVLNGSNFKFGTYLVSLLTFGSFLAILGLGQGAVVTAGGLDLSVPWAITFPAIVVTTYANGSDSAATWAIPLALCIGAGIGFFNGSLVAGLGISPIIATLATGSMLEGIALVFSHGAPSAMHRRCCCGFSTAISADCLRPFGSWHYLSWRAPWCSTIVASPAASAQSATANGWRGSRASTSERSPSRCMFSVVFVPRS